MLNEWAKVAWNVFTASIHNPCFLIIRGSAVEKLDFDFEKNRWDARLKKTCNACCSTDIEKK
jgi:hypothetical protein